MKGLTAEVLNEAVATAREYGATELILFGSALDPSRDPRDVDFACRGVKGWKLYGFGAALEERLDMPVDVVPLDEPNEFTRLIEAEGRRLL
jgi:predicted nucleotidyltransferase